MSLFKMIEILGTNTNQDRLNRSSHLSTNILKLLYSNWRAEHLKQLTDCN